ncbi:hypothetical protein KMW28_19730 [Flammeovirga yaeyamensis]|uniref:Uncharacterized protein n=1 Tax=Flammeovirga yaeyamensis TaxID=367791 RepID=A0AAX1N607_9BACT|nr:hypothetical protein [Flammeovirga yaeyamensis]MBB3701522.1 hypothetical protein [Flammeovirga yaeyamensis]NMF38664.1 hypothetical protein [Flammeovirga yaeyamensis]QWG01841.1 hypothetical protein KMW28_19730 [Flammeovirga yaeyamensis]
MRFLQIIFSLLFTLSIGVLFGSVKNHQTLNKVVDDHQMEVLKDGVLVEKYTEGNVLFSLSQ